MNDFKIGMCPHVVEILLYMNHHDIKIVNRHECCYPLLLCERCKLADIDEKVLVSD